MTPNAIQSSVKNQTGKVTPWLMGVVLALGASGAWWYSQHRGQAGQDGAGPASSAPQGKNAPRFGGVNKVQPVSVALVKRQDIRVTVNAIGTIAAANTAVVKAKIDGELKAIYFQEGQVVKAGALLAEIDPRPFQIALAQVQGQLARDQAQLQNAKLDAERFRDLLNKDGIAKQQVDTQDALVRQLQGTVQSDQAQVDSAKLQLSYTRITAPISGRLGLKQADLGNVLHASDVNGLISIAQTQPVNVVFAVPDTQLPQITSQLKAGQALPVEAWDREQKLKLADGKVASTDNAIDLATGTIKLKALFPNLDGGLFPNQSVNVRLQLKVLQGTLAVPSAAVLRGAKGTYVYLVNADKTVSTKAIRAGANDGDWVSVQGDLQPGQQVVVDGTDRLREGAQIDIITPGATASAASSPKRRHRESSN
ncbi:MdtA/MuxA family multidrug efflux RND transporter periplasmic adaptor subunit [Aquabacterium sp.]|uniref:MdtA/MuxA family multidrug efflux RND transporter periplasmic adaptor subunit n=1 Tax=Aquabacterium sp. TaxID=1872578 RepID=UPI0019A22E66|nr:MdtA/MuxA family multidrug efflux RND transporter periplasmic adaptor subunit [Aquabacterium sp.]MBC7699246.1 MdtA/MuxA family multidrug efflux RND transporter periplasmic adaptor subunit [Aquabacterium sp.]